ncbi:hypothetical protein AVHM3334_19395 [Acidovorax sp. SUPP3334]|nr:hypothetical protein AVHM3334_19395 [Acidovorax sp. SUPP3334]
MVVERDFLLARGRIGRSAAFQVHHAVLHIADAVLAVHQQIAHAQIGPLQLFPDLLEDLKAHIHGVALDRAVAVLEREGQRLFTVAQLRFTRACDSRQRVLRPGGGRRC